MGQVYYQSMRALDKTTPKLDDLKVASFMLTINLRLVSAMYCAQRAHPDRNPLIAWM